MAILLTGGLGKLGRQLGRVLPESVTYVPTHQALDITNIGDVASFIEKFNIDSVIHCAAMTNIRLCEERLKQAYETNVNGTRNLCRSLLRHCPDGYMIYVSTACVFRGDDPDKYYSEDDVPYPKNFYGLTKMLGETVVQESGLSSLIVRTNFIERGKWPYPQAFTDRYATYLYSDQLAEEIAKLYKGKRPGLVHVCGDKRDSMYGFAKLGDPQVQPMTLAEYFGPPLTVNMSLTSKRIPLVKFDSR